MSTRWGGGGGGGLPIGGGGDSRTNVERMLPVFPPVDVSCYDCTVSGKITKNTFVGDRENNYLTLILGSLDPSTVNTVKKKSIFLLILSTYTYKHT